MDFKLLKGKVMKSTTHSVLFSVLILSFPLSFKSFHFLFLLIDAPRNVSLTVSVICKRKLRFVVTSCNRPIGLNVS